jgi:hypothetical protein
MESPHHIPNQINSQSNPSIPPEHPAQQPPNQPLDITRELCKVINIKLLTRGPGDELTSQLVTPCQLGLSFLPQEFPLGLCLGNGECVL